MPAVRKVTERQMEIMVEFMEEHRAMAKGQAVDTPPEAKAALRRLWDELAALLNGQGMRLNKTGAQWRDYWRDIKYRVKKKAGEKEVDRRRTGGGPPSSVELSPLEERIYAIMGDRSVAGDVRIPFDLDEVPQSSPADVDSPPSPATEVELHSLPSDAPLSSQAPSDSPAQLQPYTSTATPVHESSSAAVASAIPDSPAPAAKKRKATGKYTPVEIPQLRWAWEGKQRRFEVEQRQLEVEQRQLKVEQRQLEVEQRQLQVEQRQLEVEQRRLKVEERRLEVEQRRLKVEARRLKAEQRRLKVEEVLSEYEQRWLKVEERSLKVEQRRMAVGERALAVQERMASALESIAGEQRATIPRWIQRNKEEGSLSDRPRPHPPHKNKPQVGAHNSTETQEPQNSITNESSRTKYKNKTTGTSTTTCSYKQSAVASAEKPNEKGDKLPEVTEESQSSGTNNTSTTGLCDTNKHGKKRTTDEKLPEIPFIGDICDLSPQTYVLKRTADACGVYDYTVIRIVDKARSEGDQNVAGPVKRAKLRQQVLQVSSLAEKESSCGESEIEENEKEEEQYNKEMEDDSRINVEESSCSDSDDELDGEEKQMDYDSEESESDECVVEAPNIDIDDIEVTPLDPLKTEPVEIMTESTDVGNTHRLNPVTQPVQLKSLTTDIEKPLMTQRKRSRSRVWSITDLENARQLIKDGESIRGVTRSVEVNEATLSQRLKIVTPAASPERYEVPRQTKHVPRAYTPMETSEGGYIRLKKISF